MAEAVDGGGRTRGLQMYDFSARIFISFRFII